MSHTVWEILVVKHDDVYSWYPGRRPFPNSAAKLVGLGSCGIQDHKEAPR